MTEQRSFLEMQMLKRQNPDPEYARWSPCETVAELVDALDGGYHETETEEQRKARMWLWEFLFQDRKEELLEQHSERIVWGVVTHTTMRDWEDLYMGVDECFDSLDQFFDEETHEHMMQDSKKYEKKADPESIYDEIYDLMWWNE